MPFATFTRVREVSSEDSVHLAENLIKSLPNKKWKTKGVGEKSAYVILEMPGRYQITGIDIGNEHSAFVEVLVGKSTCAPEEFKEILITCSFMTPTESKNSNNINRVRCFNRDALVPTIAQEKWSFVKILCTQPFNKHVPYGLSFIKVHISDDDAKNSLQKNVVSDQLLNKTVQEGKLKFREESPDSENDKNCSLFSRWKKSKHNDNEHTTAEAIRRAAKQAKTSLRLTNDNNIADRNIEKLIFAADSDGKNNSNQQKVESFSKESDADKKKRRPEKPIENNNKKRKSFDCSATSVDFSIKPSCSQSLEKETGDMSLNRTQKIEKIETCSNNTKPKTKHLKKYKPFNQLLKHVVLVISGIQNPDRGNLRNKAISMGAKYKADWDNTCTHLICAFKNTPKYNQVKGIGKIVTRSWIEKCYSTRKYLPWRRYALDSTELSKPESDEEILDDTYNPQTEPLNNNNLHNTSLVKSGEKYEERSNNTSALCAIDDKVDAKKLTDNCSSSSSESDTDDEIKRTEQNIRAGKIIAASKSVDIYEASTDEEDYINIKQSQNQ